MKTGNFIMWLVLVFLLGMTFSFALGVTIAIILYILIIQHEKIEAVEKKGKRKKKTS